MRTVAIYLIQVYKKFLSVISFGSCRYYPTCSEFAIWQYENNNFFKATYHTIVRIFRCNQMFRGGIDYPTISKLPKKPIVFKKTKIKYWMVPSKNQIIIIKNQEWKHNG